MGKDELAAHLLLRGFRYIKSLGVWERQFTRRYAIHCVPRGVGWTIKLVDMYNLSIHLSMHLEFKTRHTDLNRQWFFFSRALLRHIDDILREENE
jgi:hypothetical protein